MRNRAATLDPSSFDDDEKDAPVVERRTRRPAVHDKAEDVPWSDETGDEDADGQETIIPVSVGRKAIASNRPASESSNAYFKWDPDGEAQVVKFLDTEPWAYNQHWVQRKGRMSFPCIGKDCPLCEIGVKVTQKIVYTLVNLSQDEFPVQTLEVTRTLDETLIGYDEDKKTGPLPRHYWALSRKKAERASGFQKYSYSFLPVKERDLEDDWEISVMDAHAAVEVAEVPSPSKVLGNIKKKDLKEIADEAMAD